jgi:hypothetical protein
LSVCGHRGRSAVGVSSERVGPDTG